MVLNEALAACRVLPLILLVALPFREYVPYSVDRSNMLAKQAEERAKAMAAMHPIVTETDRYLAGELAWYKYREDMSLIQRQIERCRQNSRQTGAKMTRRLGCFIQRTKLHFKHSMLGAAKSLVGFGANLVNGLRGPGGFFLFLQMSIVLAGTFVSVRWLYYNVLPTVVELVSPYLKSADVKPDAPRRCLKPYIGIRQNVGLDAGTPGFGAASGGSAARDPMPGRLSDRDTRHSDTDGEDSGESSGQQVNRGGEFSSSEECLHSAPNVVQQGISNSPREQRGDMTDSHFTPVDTASSAPGLDQVQPAGRAKKRVAFKDEDRPLPRAAGSGMMPGRRGPYSAGGMSVDRSPSSSPPRGTATRFVPGGIRGRQSASVGRIPTSM